MAGRLLAEVSLAGYRVPRFADIPTIDSFGRPARLPPAGAGETPMIAVAPAVATRPSPSPATGPFSPVASPAS